MTQVAEHAATEQERQSTEVELADAVRHPVFARLFHWASRKAERLGFGQHRQELLAGLGGRVVEVGAGNGLNFSRYHPSLVELVAIEPEPYLRARAEEAATRAAVPVTVVEAVAERLPFEDSAFDAAVISLVLCSVADPAQALAELFRIVRPGGQLRFYEHVRSRTRRLARLQRAVDVIWPHVAGGCHSARDAEAAIVKAGFTIESNRRFSFQPCLLTLHTSPHILGRARRP